MKNKKYILIFVFVLLAIIYIIRAFASGRVIKDTLYKDTIEESITTKGLVIKNETLYTTDQQGTIEAKFTTGDRVGAGSEIAVIYKDSIDTELKNNLEQIDRKIKILETSYTENDLFANDISKLEHEISANLDAIIESGYKKDMYSITTLKYSISALAEYKSVIEGITPQQASILDSLRQKKSELQTQIGEAESSIYAKNPGLFSSYIDGLEKLITPANMNNLTPSRFNEFYSLHEKNIKANKEKKENYICKIIDNYTYYIAFNIEEKKLHGLDIGKNTGIRFYDISPNAIDAKIVHISPTQDGQATVVVECKDYKEGLLENRFVNIEFIKSSYSGYKVNIDALRTKGNENGLYVLRENIVTFIPVNILYNEKNILIVESANEEKPLRLYDEAIIHAPSYKEGQMIK